MKSAEKASNLRSKLTERLQHRIKDEGPISFQDWMQAALYDPEDGYYCRLGTDRWSRAGDYRTSPERSPLFAATFARYFAGLYEASHRPERWTIVEVGTGEGQFAEIVLSTLQQRFPHMFAITNYVVDEVSAASRKGARLRLARFRDRLEFCPLDQLEISDAGVIFSNELLDAFPVHRVTLNNNELCELYVGLDQSGEFSWITGPLSTPRLAEYFQIVGVQLTEEGQIAEVNLNASDWLANANAKLPRGYLISVDYGAEALELYASAGRRQGTLRAFRRHEFREPLENPGDNDLTSTVDWTYFRECGDKSGLETIEFQRQDQFLLRAGLLEELELMVQQSEDEAERTRLRTSAREMILPTGMANSFQVLVQKK